MEAKTTASRHPTPAELLLAAPASAPLLPDRSRGRVRQALVSFAQTLATLAILALAVGAAVVIWNIYVTAPWTRDGRIRVQVASVAPQVSGQITEIHVVDNQFVHKGDLLYVIDPFDFRTALDTASTQQRMRAADLQVKRAQSERRQTLSDLATTAEEQQVYAGGEEQSRAAFQAAQAQVSQAEINLARTRITSPVNGYVTNLLMRLGDFAHAGAADLSIIDADSFWIDGYFEETKMANVCVGDRAEAQLMGYRDPIIGRVETVTRGISVSDAAASTQGLPNVDPVYTWVRLAQRVPVRIAIMALPAGVPLISGMTATVTIRKEDAPETQSRQLARAWSEVQTTFVPPRAAPDCLPVLTSGGQPSILPTPEPSTPRSPGEINPGLAPGMRRSPNQRRP